MAEVFRALEPRAAGEPRVVVLKRMLPHIADETNAQQMFAEEARLASHITHPNVVHVLGHGEIDGQPYLTLEYVPGCDLWRLNRRLTRDSRKLEHDLVVYLVRQILSGLDAVHRATDAAGGTLGIVHRDISPSNVLISIHGDVKIADFGIARSDVNAFEANTAVRANGKLGYLAPEQVSGGDVDQRADLFSTGVIAAELFMRRPLFTGGSELAVLLAIRDAEVHPFVEFLPQLPEGLGAVILKALAASPEERPPTARAFWAALDPWQSRPEDVLRAELAALVASIAAESRLRKTSADTIPKATMPPTPLLLSDEHPSTTNVTPLEYTIRKPNGATVGPLAYAKVVEAVATGQVDGSDDVSIAGGDFQPLSSITDLYRHVPVSRMTPTTTRVQASASADLRIDFEDGGFVRALARTLVARRTGLWLCEQGGVRKEVYTKDGVPAFVTSNLAGELLGEHLVKERVITRTELDMALAVMPRFEGKLGDTLVALGLVEPLGALSAHRRASSREASRPLQLGVGHRDVLRWSRPAEQRFSAAPRRLGDPRSGLAAPHRRRLRDEAHLGARTGSGRPARANRYRSRDRGPPRRPSRRAAALREVADHRAVGAIRHSAAGQQRPTARLPGRGHPSQSWRRPMGLGAAAAPP